ncbi:hypothetical protein EC988_009219 [Linderina pennispora]|nr:hypothetical protein EC988_009219 [Linderina pennispora]
MAHAAVAAATVPLTQPLPGTVMQDPTAAAAAAVVAAAAGFPLTATQPPPLTQQMPPPPPAPPHAPVHGFVTASSAFIEQTHPSASPNPGSQAATSLVATPALNSTAFGRGLNDVQVP